MIGVRDRKPEAAEDGSLVGGEFRGGLGAGDPDVVHMAIDGVMDGMAVGLVLREFLLHASMEGFVSVHGFGDWGLSAGVSLANMF